jgi:hypothetical protein
MISRSGVVGIAKLRRKSVMGLILLVTYANTLMKIGK